MLCWTIQSEFLGFYENNNKDEDNSPKTLNDKKYTICFETKFTQYLEQMPRHFHTDITSLQQKKKKKKGKKKI